MADFEKAFAKTSQAEGGYANQPHDKGGETYAGISRKNWPSWGGWKYVDISTAKYNHNASLVDADLHKNGIVQSLVKQFYKAYFWYSLSLDGIKNQQLAENVYDFAVNAGVVTSAKRLQRAINAVCGELIVDGVIGNKTLSQANKLSGKAVYYAFNQERKVYYDNIIARDPSQAVFKRSWYSRIIPYKEVG